MNLFIACIYKLYRRNRQTYIPKKRSRKSDSKYNLFQRRQRRQMSENESIGESCETGNGFSESDNGSGLATESPFGSLMSCSTSIPSPKQLRWIRQLRQKDTYGDTTSIASSVTSPSGLFFFLFFL